MHGRAVPGGRHWFTGEPPVTLHVMMAAHPFPAMTHGELEALPGAVRHRRFPLTPHFRLRVVPGHIAKARVLADFRAVAPDPPIEPAAIALRPASPTRGSVTGSSTGSSTGRSVIGGGTNGSASMLPGGMV